MVKKTFFLMTLMLALIGFIVGCSSDENVEESDTFVEKISDEFIIEKFNEAYDFWVKWIYGQVYRAYDNPDGGVFGASRESILAETDIQSVDELRQEMEKHFSDELVEKFFIQLMPEDKNGKLYVNCGDVGGPYEGPENIIVTKIDDERYELLLDIWCYMDVDEPDEPDKYVYYVFKDGRWFFENNVEEEFFYSWK